MAKSTSVEKEEPRTLFGTALIVGASAFGLLGMAASIGSIYATPVLGAETLGCGLEALSCEVALTSQFSKFAGIPLGVFGFCYFVFWLLNLRAYLRTGDPVVSGNSNRRYFMPHPGGSSAAARPASRGN